MPVPSWAPTPADVAAITGAYQREYVGGYNAQADRSLPTFTASTSPSLSEVEAYIAGACAEIEARVGLAVLPAEVHDLANVTAKWHAAATVQVKGSAGSTGNDDGLCKAFISHFRASLDELILQARPRVLPGMY